MKIMEDSILSFFKWKDAFSLLSAIFGFLAIIEIFDKNFFVSAFFIGLAGISDYMDGFLARRYSMPTEYGAYIDTVSDAVAFCATPGVFIYFYTLTHNSDIIIHLIYLVISIIVMCAGIMRLARYLCLKDKNKNYYIGLPVTFNALIIPLIYLISEYLNFNLFFLTLISAFLMISTINFRKI